MLNYQRVPSSMMDLQVCTRLGIRCLPCWTITRVHVDIEVSQVLSFLLAWPWFANTQWCDVRKSKMKLVQGWSFTRGVYTSIGKRRIPATVFLKMRIGALASPSQWGCCERIECWRLYHFIPPILRRKARGLSCVCGGNEAITRCYTLLFRWMQHTVTLNFKLHSLYLQMKHCLSFCKLSISVCLVSTEWSAWTLGFALNTTHDERIKVWSKFSTNSVIFRRWYSHRIRDTMILSDCETCPVMTQKFSLKSWSFRGVGRVLLVRMAALSWLVSRCFQRSSASCSFVSGGLFQVLHWIGRKVKLQKIIQGPRLRRESGSHVNECPGLVGEGGSASRCKLGKGGSYHPVNIAMEAMAHLNYQRFRFDIFLFWWFVRSPKAWIFDGLFKSPKLDAC